MTEIDWNQLRTSADDATRPAPAGLHVVEIRKAEPTTAKTSGNPMYKVQGIITEGAAQGKTVFHNFNVTLDNAFAMARFFAYMEALGLDQRFFASRPSHQDVCAALIGRRAIWELSISTYQGKERNQVDDMKSLSGSGMIGVPTPNSPGIPTPGVPTPGIPTPGGAVRTGSSPSVPSAPSVPSTPPSTPMTPSTPTVPAAPPRTPFDITP